MKQPITLLLVLAALLPARSYSQLNNGGLYSNFGVDADTRSGYLRFGSVQGPVSSDDWFAPFGPGNNVIDTSNASVYSALLQSGANAAFSQRMSQLLYAKVNGKLWLDAAYGRDYTATGAAKDSTVFAGSDKNGDDPNGWAGTVSSVPTKNDLIDVYAHMRRDGTDVHDSLWFFSGVAAFGNAANSYYNIELYKNSFTYNASTKAFRSVGTSGGHTEWLFDAAGNLTQTGDMIVAVSFVPGMTPTVDVRIWVSQTTYTNYTGASTPSRFNFGAFSTTTGTYGYASILSKTGTTAFGGATSNYSGSATLDTTYNTPWGSSNSSFGWSMHYAQAQFIEVGLNMTRIGVDPALYSTLSPCQSMFSNIFFASRSSASFTSNLQDFVTPLTFLRPALMDYSVRGDTLRCNHVTGMISLTDHTTAAFYSWTVAGGGSVTGANSDSSQLTINKPGTYIVSSSPAQGCPTMRTDTIVIPIDTLATAATANGGLSGANIDLYGGNAAAGDTSAFGGPRQLTWSWTGPDGFTSNLQNPVTDSIWGNYNLTLTDAYSGCTSQASTSVLSAMFTALATNALQLQASGGNGAVALSWSDLHPVSDRSYVIQRSDGNNGWLEIGEVTNTAIGDGPAADGGDQPARFGFTDQQPVSGTDLYRIRVHTPSRTEFFSPVVSVGVGAVQLNAIYLSMQNPVDPTLVVKAASDFQGELVLYGLTGEVLSRRVVSVHAGINLLSTGAGARLSMRVGALFVNGKIAWCQKIL